MDDPARVIVIRSAVDAVTGPPTLGEQNSIQPPGSIGAVWIAAVRVEVDTIMFSPEVSVYELPEAIPLLMSRMPLILVNTALLPNMSVSEPDTSIDAEPAEAMVPWV